MKMCEKWQKKIKKYFKICILYILKYVEKFLKMFFDVFDEFKNIFRCKILFKIKI
jgi:hypothetical protein